MIILRIIFVSFLFLSWSCKNNEATSNLKNSNLDSAYAQTLHDQNRFAVNDQISQGRQTAITRAVKSVSDAVCGINVTQIRQYTRSPFFDDPFYRLLFPEWSHENQMVQSLGSGFLISPDGYILTNEHVVDTKNATEIVITLPDGSTQDAQVVGSDFISDITLLKIPGKNYPYIRFGNSDDVIIGEWVIAVGNPFGLFEINSKPTVTVGVVSAVDRDFGKQQNRRVYQDMIQTDAAINRGNSGGPLVNSLGEVIGMNTFIFTGGENNSGSIGLGFAIPINRIKDILTELKKNGEVDRSYWSGLEVDDITPLVARHFRLSYANGVIVTDVEKHSPAEKAGLEVGDVITEVNGQSIKNFKQLRRIIEDSDLRGGDVLNMKVSRSGREADVKLRLESMKK